MNIIDHNERTTYHPSLDIKNDILVLGFRIKKDTGLSTNIYLVRGHNELYTTEETTFKIGEQKYYIENKTRLLEKLSNRWGVDGLNSAIDNSNLVSKNTNPFPLFSTIRDNVEKHIELENHSDYAILTAWIVGTYLYPIFSAYPYLHIKAPKGSGKSQCLTFMQQTCFNATKARASLPALRDTVDALRGTFLIDQADALHRNHMDEMLDILTDSYKRGGGNMRKMIPHRNGAQVPEEFEVYGPKAFASINPLPEDLRDRCIVIPLIRSNKNHPQVDPESTIWKDIRSDLYLFLINHFADIDGAYLTKRILYQKENSIFGRQLELWLPLECVMSVMNVPTEVIESAKARFISHYRFAVYQTSEIELAIADAILRMIGDSTERTLRPKEIALAIQENAFEEDDGFLIASTKQKATIVGRAINKFNLADQKLPRDSQGERYLFIRDQVLRIYNSYFKETKTHKDT